MADADFWADGKWNFFCDLCGRKQKSSRAMKTWQGLYVCRHHKEVRNPQDFLRGVKDDQSVPWTRPEKTPETFVSPSPIEDTNGQPILDSFGYAIFPVPAINNGA